MCESGIRIDAQIQKFTGVIFEQILKKKTKKHLTHMFSLRGCQHKLLNLLRGYVIIGP